jgi:hypothetical protein
MAHLARVIAVEVLDRKPRAETRGPVFYKAKRIENLPRFALP